MSVWALPPELDDLILDYLHDDRATLANCALVQRAWLPTARYHNWRDLKVACAEKDLKELERLVEESPSIVHHVRNIALVQKQGETCQWYDLHLLRSALTTLSRFPSIDSFAIDGLWFGVSKQTPLPPLAATFPSVRQLRISSCTFDTFGDVQEFCSAFASVSSVKLDGVWWGRWGPDQSFANGVVPAPSSRTVHLQELELGSCFSRDKVIEWLLDIVAEGSIETLRIPLVGAYDTRLKDLLRFAGPSLRYLELGSPSTSTVRQRAITADEYRPLDSYLDLSANTHLRVLQLGVPTYRDPQLITLWLAAALSAAAHSPSLEEVRFALYPILRGDAEDAARMVDAYDWPALAAVLLRPQFSGLRRVSFVAGRVGDYEKIPGAFVSLQPVLQKVMPKLFEKVVGNGVELAFKCI